jgi:TPR repeat protein
LKISIRLAALLLAATAAISPARSAEISPALPDALIRYTRLDYVKALEMLLPLAQRGDAVAREILGFMYARGEGIPADQTAAHHWFALAADAGRTEAQFHLGRIYRDGAGVPRDSKTALYWFGRAAQHGSPDAMNAAGDIYLGRYDIHVDYAAALEWFFHAAEHGSAQAMFNICTRYALGRGVRRDRGLQMVRARGQGRHRRLARQRGNRTHQPRRAADAHAGADGLGPGAELDQDAPRRADPVRRVTTAAAR